MPKRSQPPVEPPLELKEPRDSAAAKLEDRRAKGLELKERKVDSYEDMDAFERDYKKWDAYNETLLKSLFTNDSPATEYSWSVSVGFVIGDTSKQAQYRRRFEAISELCNKLESLVDRLELIPLAPGVATAVPESATHAIDAVWQLIHPRVTQVAKQLFDDGHYANAVEAALKALNNEVKAIFRSRGGPELDGSTLMHTAFSPNNPKIVLADLGSQSGRDMQQGYMELFAGAMSAVRNPKAHDNVSISPERSLHFLFLASMLWTTLDDRK